MEKEIINQDVAQYIRDVLTSNEIDDYARAVGAGKGYGQSILRGSIYICRQKSIDVAKELHRQALKKAQEQVLFLTNNKPV